MDYMFGLPSTKYSNDFVFVVVDKFSKMAILVACKKSITTENTTKSEVHVGILPYHLAFELDYQGWSERKVLLVCLPTKDIH